MDNPNESKWAWTRRTLLRTSLVGLAILSSRLVCPSETFARELPAGRLTFLNVWTEERLDVTFRNEQGE